MQLVLKIILSVAVILPRSAAKRMSTISRSVASSLVTSELDLSDDILSLAVDCFELSAFAVLSWQGRGVSARSWNRSDNISVRPAPNKIIHVQVNIRIMIIDHKPTNRLNCFVLSQCSQRPHALNHTIKYSLSNWRYVMDGKFYLWDL